MKKAASWFMNLKFVQKVIAACILAGLLPLLTLGAFCYDQICSLLLNREQQSLTETLNQAAGSLEERLQACQGAMMLASWDQNLGLSLNRFYQNNYEMYVVYEDIIDPLFLSLRTVNPDILYCTLYTSANLNPHGNSVRPASEAMELPWYPAMSSHSGPTFFSDASEEKLTLVSPVLSAGLNNGQKQNYLAMALDYEHMFSPLDSIYGEDFAVLLLDASGNPVYSFLDLPDSELNQLCEGKLSVSGPAKGKTGNLMTARRTVADGSWELVLCRSLASVKKNTRSILTAVWLVILACALLLALLSGLFSQAMVRPLERLAASMKEVEGGNLSAKPLFDPDRRDEIGVLMNRFSSMVERLRFLVNEVYKNKIEKQEYEFKALQAQINPHFFYNSLSLINSKAIIAGQDDISQMAQLLSTFYRTTLNSGKDTITVGNEWTNMTSYLKIQLMMHRNSFDVKEELDPGLKNCLMPNLLLQPLVENAVIHGIDTRQGGGRGLLSVTGFRENDRIVFTVSDNGCGMEKEQIDEILTAPSKGYGVQNVNRRIKLYAGEEYGLFYESRPGEGTTVTLTLPLKGEEEA